MNTPQRQTQSSYNGWLLITSLTLVALVLNVLCKKSFPLRLLRWWIMGIVINLACFTPFLALAIWRGKPEGWHNIGLALGVWFMLFQLSLGLSQNLVVFGTSELDWTGRTFVTIASLAFIKLWREIGWREIGFTGLKKGSWLPFIIIALVLSLLGSPAENKSTTLELLIYRLAVFAITEEIISRGIVLALFNRAFGKPWTILKTNIGWGWILTSVLFGLIHGIAFNGHFQPQFNIAAILFTGIGALIMGWLRERTGSLYPPIVVHALGDGVHYLIDVLLNGFA